MRSTELAQIDPVHGPLGVNSDSQLEPTTGFDFDSVDRNVFNVKDEENDVVELSEASRALGMIIQWACESKDIKLVGARVAALGCLLYADHMPHNRTNLSAIAEEAGCTKQCISKGSWTSGRSLASTFLLERAMALAIVTLRLNIELSLEARIRLFADGRITLSKPHTLLVAPYVLATLLALRSSPASRMGSLAGILPR